MSDAQRFRDHVDAHRERLAQLPYSAHSEPDGDPFEILARALEEHTPLEVIRWEANLSDPYYRVLALDFLSHHHEKPTPATWPTTVLEDERVIEGDLHVEGNLTNRSNLVVLGDLRVDGGYLALGDYPCVSVAGNFTCRALYANEAETLCLGKLQATAELVVVYNHTVTIARELHAATLIRADAGIDGEIHSPNDLEDPSYETIALHFGLKDIDFDADDFDADEHIWDAVIGSVLGEG